MNTPRPVLIMNSVLAGLGVLLGGSALADVLPVTVVGLAALILAAIQVGWSLYVQGQVTPIALVAARRLPVSGDLVAGPAAPGVTQEGEIVDVTKAEAA